MAGALRPSGKARTVDGGLVAKGRWSFASGIRHSGWWAAGCTVRRRQDAAGLPPEQWRVIDTWTTGGMRGTGSHDYAVKELFIPIERIVAIDGPARLANPLYRLPMMALMDSPMAAVPLGIAAGGDRRFRRDGRRQGLAPFDLRVADKPAMQAEVGRAEAALQAARAWLYGGGPGLGGGEGRPDHIDKADRAMRLARANAMTAGVQAIDLIYSAAGSASVYCNGPIDRCFRDVHVAAASTWRCIPRTTRSAAR